MASPRPSPPLFEIKICDMTRFPLRHDYFLRMTWFIRTTCVPRHLPPGSEMRLWAWQIRHMCTLKRLYTHFCFGDPFLLSSRSGREGARRGREFIATIHGPWTSALKTNYSINLCVCLILRLNIHVCIIPRLNTYVCIYTYIYIVCIYASYVHRGEIGADKKGGVDKGRWANGGWSWGGGGGGELSVQTCG